jgi:hypothetical protein
LTQKSFVGRFDPLGFAAFGGSVQTCCCKFVEPKVVLTTFVQPIKNPAEKGRVFIYGALGWIRTTDRSVRSRVLYPAELRVHLGLISEVAYYR